MAAIVTAGWWEDLFELRPGMSERAGHKCGERQMLTLVSYDICEPKRLQKVAKVCENWGFRIQYSVFECQLEADRFDLFWDELLRVIDPSVDRVVAYKICLRCAREVRDAGTMVHAGKVIAYVC